MLDCNKCQSRRFVRHSSCAPQPTGKQLQGRPNITLQWPRGQPVCSMAPSSPRRLSATMTIYLNYALILH
eukprot:scaffold630922_cov31-Prasinocladus_malaysianus.AAC.1